MPLGEERYGYHTVSMGGIRCSPLERDSPHISQQLAAESIIVDRHTLRAVSTLPGSCSGVDEEGVRLILALGTKEPGGERDGHHDQYTYEDAPSWR